MRLFPARKATVPIVFVLVVFLLVGFLGFSHFGMAGMDGHIANCPLAGMATLCDMTAIAHLSSWQQMFATTLQHMALALLFLILSFAITRCFCGLRLESWRERFVFRRKHREEVFDALRLALARGIIHPKVY